MVRHISRSVLRARSRADTVSTRTTTNMAPTLSVVSISGLAVTRPHHWTSSTRVPCDPVCDEIVLKFSLLVLNAAS